MFKEGLRSFDEDLNSFLKHALRIARKWKGTVDEIIVSSGSDKIKKLRGLDSYSKANYSLIFFRRPGQIKSRKAKGKGFYKGRVGKQAIKGS